MFIVRTFLLAVFVAVLALVSLGVWSYYDSARFTVEPAQITLSTVKARLASIFRARVGSSQPIPILMYHYVRGNVSEEGDRLGYDLSLPPGEFRQQLALLKAQGWHTVKLADVLAGHYDAKSVVLTFDDGYKDFILEAYPLLREYGFTATIFIITANLTNPAHLSADDVVFLANQGFEFGSHSATHANLTNQNNDQLLSELATSQTTLSRLIERAVPILSYPAGQYDGRVVTAAERVGYQLAVTTDLGIAVPQNGLMSLARQRVRRGLSNQEFLSLLAD